MSVGVRAWAALLGGIIAAAFASTEVSATGNKLSPPLLYCGDATQASLELRICGGATGTPAGFVLKWLELAPSAPWPPTNDNTCFSYFYSKYRGQLLKPGECITVSIGELLADRGHEDRLRAGAQVRDLLRLQGLRTTDRHQDPERPDRHSLLQHRPLHAGQDLHPHPGLLEDPRAEPDRQQSERVAGHQPEARQRHLHRRAAPLDSQEGTCRERPDLAGAPTDRGEAQRRRRGRSDSRDGGDRRRRRPDRGAGRTAGGLGEPRTIGHERARGHPDEVQ